MSNEIKNAPDNRDRENDIELKTDTDEVSGSSDCSVAYGFDDLMVQVVQQDPIWSHGITKESGRHGMSNHEYKINGKGQEIIASLKLALLQAEFEFGSNVDNRNRGGID